MATVEHVDATFKRVEDQPEKFVLTLDKDEAIALQTVLGRVAGHNKNSRRGYTARIYRALERAGIRWSLYDDMDRDYVTGSVHFADERGLDIS